jgi:hypothetical protein
MIPIGAVASGEKARRTHQMPLCRDLKLGRLDEAFHASV